MKLYCFTVLCAILGGVFEIGCHSTYWVEIYLGNISVLLADSWNHSFHCTSNSVPAPGLSPSLVVLASVLHSGKYLDCIKAAF